MNVLSSYVNHLWQSSALHLEVVYQKPYYFFDVELTRNVTLVPSHKCYTVLSSPPAEPPPVPKEHDWVPVTTLPVLGLSPAPLRIVLRWRQHQRGLETPVTRSIHTFVAYDKGVQPASSATEHWNSFKHHLVKQQCHWSIIQMIL